MNENSTSARLSTREKEILEALSHGYNTNEIADQLQISSHTVDTHRKNLLRKINAKNVAHLIRKSVINDWLDLSVKAL